MIDIPLNDRPREKLINLGPGSLGDNELLAILISSGNGEKSVMDISKGILGNHNFSRLSKMSVSQLSKEFGIGKAKACQICACFEMGRRASGFVDKDIKINCAQDIFKMFGSKMSDLQSENFKVVYLNTRRKVLCDKTLFVGTLSESVVSPREIFRVALDEGAAAAILIHNHPSGDPSPSDDDINITKELIEAGKILGVDVLDHIIIGRNNYWSIMENGLI